MVFDNNHEMMLKFVAVFNFFFSDRFVNWILIGIKPFSLSYTQILFSF